MKKCCISFCILFTLCCVALCGCFKRDLTDYRRVGYSWVLSDGQSDYYKITFISYSDTTVFLDLDICEEHLEDEYIYLYSAYPTKYNLECNGVTYTESFMVPLFLPIGMYEVPVEGSHYSLKLNLIEDKKVNGYLKVSLNEQATGSYDVLKMIAFSVY